MTQKAFFESLGAPLVNYRWSWGAVRNADGAILLRVWQDKENLRTYMNKQFVRVLRGVSNRLGPHGEHERRERMEHIRNGAPYFLIMCEAEDTAARPRRVRRFNAKQVFSGGAIKQIEDDLWTELLPGFSIEEFAARKQPKRQ